MPSYYEFRRIRKRRIGKKERLGPNYLGYFHELLSIDNRIQTVRDDETNFVFFKNSRQNRQKKRDRPPKSERSKKGSIENNNNFKIYEFIILLKYSTA